MEELDAFHSRLHEVDMRPPPVQAEPASHLGKVLVGVLIAVMLAASWIVLGR